MNGAQRGNLHIAINGWFAGDPASGSGQYTDHLLAYLPRLAPNARFSLLLPVSRHTDSLDLVARWPGVDLVRMNLPPLPENVAKLWWEQVAMPVTARRLQADVLWVPYWAAPYYQPIPTVVTIHDLIPLLLPAYRGDLIHRVYTWLVSHTARRAAAVITVSQASARDVVTHLNIPSEQVVAVHHGPNQEGQPPPDADRRAAVRARYNLPERFFLYLGGFDVRKNVNATLAAYCSYLDRGGDPTIQLVIAGKLPAQASAFFPDPQATAAAMQLSEQVHFCGWIEEPDKPAVYALATAYLFPSLYEGFGMTVLEAMQAGTPVVTSSSE